MTRVLEESVAQLRVPPPPDEHDVARLRTPPHSMEAEQSLLGGLLLESAAFAKVSDVIGSADFYRHEHRHIFDAITALIGAGEPVDVITVFERLRDQPQDVGGLVYLNSLAASVPSASNIRRYAEIVRDRACLRSLVATADRIAACAFQAKSLADAAPALREAQAEIEKAANAAAIAPAARPVVLNLSALRDQKAPERQWVIPGWLGFDPTLFAAAGGVGKSLLAQATATALAIGRSFIGAEVARPFRCMVVACEDDADELARRQERISEHFGIAIDEPGEQLVLQSRRGCDNVLMARDRGELRRTALYEHLRQQVNDLGIEVLWLDNVAHVFAGDEINRSEVTQFINAMAGLVAGRSFAVVLLAHTARSSGSEYAGSAAWENAVRMRWYLGNKLPDQKDDEEPEGDIRYLARRKSNYSRGDYVKLRLSNGVLVPEAGQDNVGGIVAQIDERQAEQAVLAAFHGLRSMGLNPTDAKNSPDYLPKQAVSKGLAGGFTVRDLDRGLNRLMRHGTFRRGEVGRYANRNPKLGLVLSEGQS